MYSQEVHVDEYPRRMEIKGNIERGSWKSLEMPVLNVIDATENADIGRRVLRLELSGRWRFMDVMKKS